ncbi:MAG: hypothetical protein D8M52_04655 [Chlorobi bacterium]|nr:MAG: hypothetical protein F9K28_03785 [Bacteroidota bacterium]MBE2264969.1 fibronectin type III domain-containing protein [Flavobacteriales bacterium]MBL1160994.1 hypothetical protein [Chlorobiota bacterium]MBZ0194099.1 fibronectin type III domain-containing protein [Candidatus Kapabacteria bacterium]MCC6330796.1 fibronectin type III domain-containing protein [Ignavibacteria bacterium]
MRKFLAMSASIVALLFLVTACETTTNPDPVKTAPNAPTDLMASSTNETTVTLKWSKAATGQEPTGYIVSFLEAGAVQPQSVAISGSATTTAAIQGLTEGKLYAFSVRAVNDTAKSDPSASVTWAPAKRYSGTFKLYSSQSTTEGSGLSLKTGTVLKLADADKWEFCFDDKDGRPLVGSPGVSGYNAPSGKEFPIVSLDTTIAHMTRANSLNDVFDVRALDNVAAGSFTEALINLADPRLQPTTGVALIVRSRVDQTTVNFAKVLIKPNLAGNSWVFGTGANSYIECEVSYQTVTNVPYAEMQRLFGGAKRGNHSVE